MIGSNRLQVQDAGLNESYPAQQNYLAGTPILVRLSDDDVKRIAVAIEAERGVIPETVQRWAVKSDRNLRITIIGVWTMVAISIVTFLAVMATIALGLRA